MNRQPHTGHRAIIQAALEDWWITADLGKPFEPHEAATQIDTYLINGGYTINPDTPRTPMPTRASITLAAILALACLGAAIASATQGDWLWTLAGLIGAGTFTYEVLGDIAERRHHRTQPAAQPHTEARSRTETPAHERYRFATTWDEYHEGRRAALDKPTQDQP